jgi:branched-subunit amino acid transport protein
MSDGLSNEVYVWLTILGITLATFITRSGLLVLGARLQLPPSLEAALRYAPACALAAIIAPELIYLEGSVPGGWDNPKLLAGLAGIAIFAAIRSMIATIVGGMAVFWLIRWAFGVG